MMEGKWAESKLSPNFALFAKYFSGVKQVQISKNIEKEKTYPNGTEIRLAHNWLAELNIT